MKNYIQIGTVLIVMTVSSLTMSSCTDGKGDTQKIKKKADPVPVKVVEINPEEQTTEIVTSGKITTDHESLMSFKMNGVVDRVYVSEGDRVVKGQLLAMIDQREVNTIVEQARLGYEKSKRDFARVENLFKDSVVTLEQLQNANTALDVSREQLESAEFTKQYSRIVAPFNGFVLQKFVNNGQVVGVGDPVVRINKVDENAWILKVNVTDRQHAIINTKDLAEVKLDAFPEKVFKAWVLRKSEATDPVTGTFTVDLSVKDARSLAAGMFGTAKIFTKASAKVWTIPYEAVLDANKNEGFVFVTADYKTAVKLPVTISSFDQNAVAVSAGLDNYKALIVSGSAYLSDKSLITIIK